VSSPDPAEMDRVRRERYMEEQRRMLIAKRAAEREKELDDYTTSYVNPMYASSRPQVRSVLFSNRLRFSPTARRFQRAIHRVGPFRLTDRPALFFLAERPAVRGGAVGGGAEREARAAAERARDGDARGAEREAREHRGERASGGEIDTKSCSHLMREISSVS
jgi:hypothetical protein